MAAQVYIIQITPSSPPLLSNPSQVKNVGEVELGKYRMSTWYFSPLPKDMMKNGYVDVLYVCEFTFNFFVRKEELLRFQAESGLERRHPPGNEIYRCGNLSSKLSSF